MALAQFSDRFWFPSGVLAVGVAARVFPLSSNVLAPLFADADGTIPLANPLTTDGTGSVTFWAEAAEYWLHIDTETFRINVGLPEVNPTTFAALQADVVALQAAVTTLQTETAVIESMAETAISTGIAAGGDISVNGISSSAIDIAPLTGYVTDFITDPFNPGITRVDYPGGTVEMDAGSLARTATAWLMDVNQVITQQGTPPTNAQRRTHIMLGVTAQVGGVIIVDQSLPVILQQPANQLADLITSLGAFSISGNRVTPNGANLMINQSSGELFSQAFNHFAGPVQTNDPHVSTTIAQTPASFRYVTQSAPVFGPLTALVDVGNYDVGGVVTPVPGGANASTIHRVYMFPNNTATEQIAFQYGQTSYSSLANAVAAIGAGTFTPNPLMRAAALIGYIAVIRTATNLSNTAQAVFVAAGKFATP